MLDLVVKSGFVVDGTGNVWFKADVGIKDGRITKVGNLSNARAERVLDVAGLVVCPGFIDVHTHSDLPILLNPEAESSLRMGATTHIVGNCGASAGPRRPGDALLFLAGAMESDWCTLGEYFDRLEQSATSINIASLVGHGTLRDFVMGQAFARPADSQEIEKMKRLVVKAMEDGAVGLSSGLNFSPGQFADTGELVALCKVVAYYGGVYATHMRGQGDSYHEAIAEAIEIGEKSGVAVHLAHQGPTASGWGRSPEFLAAVTEARKRGVDVTIDVIAGVEAVGSLNDMFPPWTAEGGLQQQLRRFKDPELRGRIKRELEGEAEWTRNNPALLARGGRWDLFGIHEARDRSLVGKTFAELAESTGEDPFDILLDYLVEEGEARGTLEIAFSEEDIKYMATLPFQMFSSDVWPAMEEEPLGSTAAYPTQYGAFPWVYRRLVREEGVLTLEEAVSKMTSLPAQRFQLWDRGLIREGLWADIVILDPDRIADQGTWKNPRQYPVGIEYVLVNGVVTIEKGQHTGALVGRVLRHTTAG